MVSDESYEDLGLKYGEAVNEKRQLKIQLALARAVNDDLTEEIKRVKDALKIKEAECSRLKEERDTLAEQLNLSEERLRSVEKEHESMWQGVQGLLQKRVPLSGQRGSIEDHNTPRRRQSMSESSPGESSLQDLHSQPQPPVSGEERDRSIKVLDEASAEIHNPTDIRSTQNTPPGDGNDGTPAVSEDAEDVTIKDESDDDIVIIVGSKSLQERIVSAARQVHLTQLAALIVMMETGATGSGVTGSQLSRIAKSCFGVDLTSPSSLLNKLYTRNKILLRLEPGLFRLQPDYEGMRLFEYKDYGKLGTLYAMALRYQSEIRAQGDDGHEDQLGSTSHAGPASRAPQRSLEKGGRNEIPIILRPVTGYSFNHRAMFTALGNSLKSLYPHEEQMAADNVRMKVQECLKDLPPAILSEYISLS
ncbi:hypothetical protein HDV00_004024 [Rhizophlyctis rosea]|nr:hypothetical protein HDV00_004024 [Rhizophlyctis rosea]